MVLNPEEIYVIGAGVSIVIFLVLASIFHKRKFDGPDILAFSTLAVCVGLTWPLVLGFIIIAMPFYTFFKLVNIYRGW